MPRERTFVAVKPDGVQRSLVGDIIKRFETKGLKLAGLKMLWPSKQLLEEHYKDLATKPFFGDLVQYMSSGPVVAMVWEGANAVSFCRKVIGETRPLESPLGTIRGDLCLEVGRNVVHGSDSVETAKKEIGLWFQGDEVVNWDSAEDKWVHES